MVIRGVIVDDHQPFLEVASTVLGREGLEIVGVASNREEALRQVESLRPDVVLVDVFLGEESGLELARQLVDGDRPDPATVILISSHSADDLADLIVVSHADGFITKTELSAAAIRQVVDANARRDT